MKSLVLELQAAVWDSDEKVTNLLRKALVVAKKLEIKDFENWILSEMHGYKDNPSSIPAYREVKGRVRAFNRYHGWQNVYFGSIEDEHIASIRKLSQSVVQLEDLYLGEGDLTTKVPLELVDDIYNEYGVEPLLVFPKSGILQIIESVKSTILDWALKLEKDGILGEGMTFSKEEKEKAAQQSYTTIIHNMYNSQLQQGSINSEQTLSVGVNISEVKELLDLVLSHISKMNLSSENNTEIQNEITTIESELQETDPKPGVIKTGLNVIARIIGTASESAITDRVTNLITDYAGKLF
ncbi:AbiTii domain-containing protein [Bacillus sp. Au-Bac7]|uniref:AbiTii domain-containing protein n=1 Tax=Bacillus sp. Au-Bac7 TaxID=2906458 RepID=UPI001E32E49D|nr:hypothetical protein [Bacillus sp. Au-Bac7]MCE4051882.1 hypothetical protein [Bacillus sp. Au-Bac7]